MKEFLVISCKTHLRLSFTLMMVILTLVFRRTPRVMPGEGIIRVVVVIGGGVDGGAGGACGVVQRRVDGALGAHALPVGARQRAPAAVRVVEALRTLK